MIRVQKLQQAAAPTDPAALVKRLGSVPFWRGQADFLQTMTASYASAVQAGLEVLEQDFGVETELENSRK
mgnify:CR=1 FL=1